MEFVDDKVAHEHIYIMEGRSAGLAQPMALRQAVLTTIDRRVKEVGAGRVRAVRPPGMCSPGGYGSQEVTRGVG